ncbi:hypothetical protein U9M48_018704 [Paspalum notatum var. saurae]|uniref:DNA helicase Pif1-like 2B domain-containing protein n=1 Tax=Paspalum notatum var. saurae TaxID=547442 RepID=A0AAQ3TCB9_PASNO
MGGNIDKKINNGDGPYVFRVNGQIHHRIGSLLPLPNNCPKFAELYIFDTKNEIENRIRTLTREEPNEQNLDPEIVKGLQRMLDEYNPLVKIFRQARDFLEKHKGIDISVRIIGADKGDKIQYEIPHQEELAILIVVIEIPKEFLIQAKEDKIQASVESTYPDLQTKYTDPDYIKKRAILATTNDAVDEINDYIISLLPAPEREYYSADSISKCTDTLNDANILYPVEYLNTLNANNFPPHRLKLKVGTPVMLLRNLNQNLGLCNGTRIMMTQLGDTIIEGTIITGTHVGEKTHIPRINLTTKGNRWPFTLCRHQFPIKVCYSVTINKSQGQTLSNVGLYLKKKVFTHGQLYGLKILIENDDGSCGTMTENIVYKEMSITPLSQVRPRVYTYTICVRISRVWEFHGKNDDDTIKHLDLVVIDQKLNPMANQPLSSAAQLHVADKLIRQNNRSELPPEISAIVGEKLTVVIKVYPAKSIHKRGPNKDNKDPTFDILNIKKRHGKDLLLSMFKNEEDTSLLGTSSSQIPKLPPLEPIQQRSEEIKTSGSEAASPYDLQLMEIDQTSSFDNLSLLHKRDFSGADDSDREGTHGGDQLTVFAKASKRKND